ncbi:torsin-1A-interacting protein 2-like [Branchiostoma lanceolatum]|uniref:torsin-1A-interacting protein 2-like n=1 Tax=Branchiostoma lanceolatum TaxID=7740 RepID=UPI003453546B
MEDIMRAWSTDVIVIHDVDCMPSYVMDVVQTTCQSNGAGQVVVMTSGEKPEIADPVSIAVRPERTEAPLERISLGNPEEGLAVIRRRFPSQTDRVWQVVRAAILSHIAETDPVKPAVVIIGAPPRAHRTADQLAQALARIYAEKSITIDSRQFAQVNAARAKLHLDRVLEPGLLGSHRRESGVLGSARAVVLTRLEALPGDAAMLFHGYCDHSDAQYKSAAYFFTVHCSEEIDPTLNYKNQERMVHQQLQRAWRNLPATHLDPLLGRITPLTTVVTPEGEMELSKE